MDASLLGWRDQLWLARLATIDRLGALTDADLERPWRWRERDWTVRFGLLRLADEDQATLTAVTALAAAGNWRPSAVSELLGQAEISRGALLSAMLALDTPSLDRQVSPAGWSPRRILAHLVLTERRYYQRIGWDVRQDRAGVVDAGEPPDGVVEPMSELEMYERGGLPDFLERLAVIREEALSVLADLTEADLAAVSAWAGHTVDIRFRLLRFASHEREHTAHLEQTLADLDLRPSQARRLLGQAQVTRGHLLARLVGLTGAPPALTNRVGLAVGALVAAEEALVASLLAALD